MRPEIATNQYYKELFVALTALLFIATNASSYDDNDSHKRITKKAVEDSRLNGYLLDNMAFIRGLETNLPLGHGMAIRLWLEEGSKLEDAPACRASNHFHNPLKAWNQSQMNDLAGIVGWGIRKKCISDGWLESNRTSAVTWATGYIAPAPDGNKVKFTEDPSHSPINWNNARAEFYSALTATHVEKRDTSFTQTFQALGQVLHLLQDMAVPAHVRNDFMNSHVYTGGSNPYELYVKSTPEQISR